MKKILTMILVSVGIWTNLQAQLCTCDFVVTFAQDPIDSCCFNVLLCQNGGVCNPANNYNQIIVTTNGSPNTIGSVTSNNPNVTPSQTGNFQANFAANFNNPFSLTCNSQTLVGRICLVPQASFSVTFSVQMTQVTGNICAPAVMQTSFIGGSCPTPEALFEKIYGDAQENRPAAVKAFGNGIYVAGYRVVGGADYGTFSKFDLTTGALQWEKQLAVSTRILDFDYDAATDELLLVGHTTPLNSTTNNRSFLLRIIGATGVQSNSFYFDQPGRESFTRIVRHPNPLNAGFPFYVLGRKNPVGSAPSSNDVVVLYNVSAAGVVNWVTEYAYSSGPTDDEFYLGLNTYSNGNLIITGLITGNEGALLLVDGSNVTCGTNGCVINSVRYPQILDIHDGIELPFNRFAIVGENFATNRAFAVVLDEFNNFASDIGASSLEFSNITNFKDIWKDQYGKLYVIGENKIAPLGPSFQVVHKLNDFFHAGATTLTVDWAKYLKDAPPETDYDNGVISVTPAHDRIFYADARLKNPSFFGNWDMLVGAYDLSLSSACVFDFPFPTNALPLTPIAINVNDPAATVPTSITNPIQPVTYCCTNFCSSSPCTADFTWTLGNCFAAQLTATHSTCLQGTYTYDWDFDCNGSIDATSNSPVISHTFPCGGGMFNVCLTVTDPHGCAATATHLINVNNCINCGIVTNTSLVCNPNNRDAYNFCITVQNVSTATSCVISLGTLAAGLTLSNQTTSYNGQFATICGTVTVAGVTPLVLNMPVVMTCTCPPPLGGTFVCNIPVALNTICCKGIAVADVLACEDAPTLNVSIQALGTLHNISQVLWYVQPKPVGGICPTVPWGGTPYQHNFPTSVLEPLHLYPPLMSGDLCFYAVVILNDGPCTMLTSNIACANFCEPNTCSLNDQDFCYTGACVTPGPITLTIAPNPDACPPFPVYQWFDPAFNLVATGVTTYTPTQCLHMSNPMVDCYQDFFYTVRITDACGVHECQARIRLYSDTAPKGTLAVEPFEPNVFCPGEDATLHFTPGCDSDDPKTWFWFTRPCVGGVSTPIPNSGNMNPYWNTNQLYQSVYYFVQTQNGVCPADTSQVKIEVKELMSIVSFNAVSDPCVEQFVNLSLNFLPCNIQGCNTACACNHTVEWYKDDFLIGTTNVTSPGTTASFSYTTMPLAGNYYAVLKSDCCMETLTTSVISFSPCCKPVVIGPCFICNNVPVTVSAQMVIPPSAPCPSSCTFTWYQLGNPNPIGSGSSLLITTAGTYVLVSDCNGCIKSVTFTMSPCTSAQGPIVTWRDFDSDGFGDPNQSVSVCGTPPGYVNNDDDCNDMNPDIHPGAMEVCNGLDDDCSGSPEAVVNTWTGLGDNLNWSLPTNWSAGAVPLLCQEVVIPANKTVRVAAGYHGVGKTLTVSPSAVLTVEGTGILTIQN